MPDILIRGMEMPPSCADCPIKGDSYCRLTRQKVKYYHEDRHDLCPLVELPPHGDLIDIEKAKEAKFKLDDDFPNDYQLGWNDAIDSLTENAPVVVPAERSSADA